MDLVKISFCVFLHDSAAVRVVFGSFWFCIVEIFPCLFGQFCCDPFDFLDILIVVEVCCRDNVMRPCEGEFGSFLV